MATHDISTSVRGVYLRVKYNVYVDGNYPSITMRVTYSTCFYFPNGGTVQWNGAYMNVGGDNRQFSINHSGPGESATCTSGTLRYGFGNSQSKTQRISVYTKFGNILADGAFTVSASIPGPSTYQIDDVSEITPFTARVNYRLSNVRNYWRIRVKDTISGKTWSVNPDNGNGTSVLTNLKPETKYSLKAEVLNRSGGVSYTGVGVEFTTIADQLKLAFNQSGNLKMARVFYNDNGVIKKVKKCYVNQNGSIKRVKNYGGV